MARKVRAIGFARLRYRALRTHPDTEKASFREQSASWGAQLSVFWSRLTITQAGRQSCRATMELPAPARHALGRALLCRTPASSSDSRDGPQCDTRRTAAEFPGRIPTNFVLPCAKLTLRGQEPHRLSCTEQPREDLNVHHRISGYPSTGPRRRPCHPARLQEHLQPGAAAVGAEPRHHRHP